MGFKSKPLVLLLDLQSTSLTLFYLFNYNLQVLDNQN